MIFSHFIKLSQVVFDLKKKQITQFFESAKLSVNNFRHKIGTVNEIEHWLG